MIHDAAASTARPNSGQPLRERAAAAATTNVHSAHNPGAVVSRSSTTTAPPEIADTAITGQGRIARLTTALANHAVARAPEHTETHEAAHTGGRRSRSSAGTEPTTLRPFQHCACGATDRANPNVTPTSATIVSTRVAGRPRNAIDGRKNAVYPCQYRK